MDEELKKWLLDKDDFEFKNQMHIVDDALKEALAAIRFSKQWHLDEARKLRGCEYRAYLERVYLKLKEALKRARETAARRNYQEQFQLFSLAARELEEELARKPPKSLLAGWADGMEASAAREEAFTHDPVQRAETAAWLAKRRAEREKEEGGGDDGGMGAGLNFDPEPPGAERSTYEELVAAHRAAAKKKPPKKPEGSDNDNNGPEGP